MYPVAIVVIVSVRYSILDRRPERASEMQVTFGALEFAGQMQTHNSFLVANDPEQGLPDILVKEESSEEARAKCNADSCVEGPKEPTM